MSKIDPFQLHPEQKTSKKTGKIVLTKEKVLRILKEEVDRIMHLDTPTWGWTTDDLLQIVDNIEEKVENYDV